MKIGCKLLDHKIQIVQHFWPSSKKELETMYDWVSPEPLIQLSGEYKPLKEHILSQKNVR